jgi:hypothetical protein
MTSCRLVLWLRLRSPGISGGGFGFEDFDGKAFCDVARTEQGLIRWLVNRVCLGAEIWVPCVEARVRKPAKPVPALSI